MTIESSSNLIKNYINGYEVEMFEQYKSIIQILPIKPIPITYSIKNYIATYYYSVNEKVKINSTNLYYYWEERIIDLKQFIKFCKKQDLETLINELQYLKINLHILNKIDFIKVWTDNDYTFIVIYLQP